MIKRVKTTKIGDVFVANIDGEYNKYLQYIVSDMEQLNSDVIRVFKKRYSIDDNPTLEEIISDDIDFYTHATTKAGVKFEFWKLVGNISQVGDVKNLMFRGSEDSGDASVTISEKWYVWNVNKHPKYVGKLRKKYYNAEIGPIYPPKDVIERIKTGIADPYYPKYE